MSPDPLETALRLNGMTGDQLAAQAMSLGPTPEQYAEQVISQMPISARIDPAARSAFVRFVKGEATDAETDRCIVIVLFAIVTRLEQANAVHNNILVTCAGHKPEMLVGTQTDEAGVEQEVKVEFTPAPPPDKDDDIPLSDLDLRTLRLASRVLPAFNRVLLGVALGD